MQTQVLVQPPPLLALAQQVNDARPRVTQQFFLDDLSQLVDSPQSTNLDKELSNTAQSGLNYSYASQPQFDDAAHPGPHDLYETALSTSPQGSYASVSNASQQSNCTLASRARHADGLSPTNGSSRFGRETEVSARYLSSSPSPVEIHAASSFPQPYSAPHHQDHFASSAISYPPDMDRYSIANLTDRYLRGTDKYSHTQHPLLDQRRMSEPAMYGSATGSYPTNAAADLATARYQQIQHEYSYASPRSYGGYSSSLHRTLSSGAVRDQLSGSSWKDEDQLPLHSYDSVDLEEPLSPLNPTFSGGEGSPSMGMPGMPYGSLHEDYGPSPPGTGTSTTSSNAPATRQQAQLNGSNSPSNSKQYSFVSLPGNAVKKRPRRRYDEIERLYQCSWPDCTKSYGTLNHLNAHVTMQKHGAKRSPNEFKELRKQWRKAKKEEAEARSLGTMRQGSQHHPSHRHLSREALSDADFQSYHVRPHLDSAHHPDRFTPPTGSLDDLHDLEAHQREVYARRQQRFSAFVSPHARNSGAAYHSPSHPPGINIPNVPMNRLPTNSTLLTPLPGYEPSTMNGVADLDLYSSYDVYGGDSRPGTGHGSVGSFDDRRRPSLYAEGGRGRSTHLSLGTGQGPDY
ncbi:hypothetical protein HYDPIDRAFT_27617 [Hydnomerulius pinastri MD-312]|nr:hypothetical protein HYDPIDRAFT_27617 [Hydnomerulius pinastri MD-312]